MNESLGRVTDPRIVRRVVLTYPKYKAEKTLVPYMIARQGGSIASMDRQWPNRPDLWDFDAWAKWFDWNMGVQIAAILRARGG